METIKDYESGLISYDDFQLFMWGSGDRLIDEVGHDIFTFYLMADEGIFYEYC